jgi:type I restriction enzyme, S subunit
VSEGDRDLPDGWKWMSLLEAAGKVQYGWTTSARREGSVKLLRTTDITSGPVDWSTVPACETPPPDVSKYELHSGDIVVSRAGSVGFSYLVDDTCPAGSIFASYLMRLRPHDAVISPRYLKHYMNSPRYWADVADGAVGIGMSNLNGSKLGAMQVPVPPRSAQDAICDELDRAFLGAGLIRSRLASAKVAIERFRQSVLVAACSGRLTADWRRYHPFGSKSEALPDLPPKRDDDEAHALPETWRRAQLGDIAEVKLGGTPSRKEPAYWDGDISWVSSGEVANCRILSTREKITSTGLTNSNAKTYPTGTVLIAMIGEGKTRGQAAILDIPAATNQNVAGVLSNRQIATPEYLWRWALAQYAITRAVGRGGNQPALNGQKVRELSIPVPPLEEQEAIVSRVDALLAQADSIEGHLRLVAAHLDNFSHAVLDGVLGNGVNGAAATASAQE